jgi:hypothetical protein
MAKQAAVKAAAVKADVAAVAAAAPVAYVLTAEQTADVAKLAVSFFALTDAADNVKIDAYDILVGPEDGRGSQRSARRFQGGIREGL